MVAKKRELKSQQYSLRVTDRFLRLIKAMSELENRSVANMLDEIVERAAAQAGVSVPETDAKPARKRPAKKR